MLSVAEDAGVVQVCATLGVYGNTDRDVIVGTGGMPGTYFSLNFVNLTSLDISSTCYRYSNAIVTCFMYYSIWPGIFGGVQFYQAS